jgi:hypothetical protein
MSIDIDANWSVGEGINVTLNLLVECKYRARNKSLLFIPEPNRSYSPVVIGATIQIFDFSVPYSLPLRAFEDVERAQTFVYKGLEISNDGAFEQQVWHGIQQLRYGVPIKLLKTFEYEIVDGVDPQANIFVPMLVTNAPIKVLNAGCTMADVEAAESLDEISHPHDSVILYSDYGPDYEDHVRRVFAGVTSRLERPAKSMINRLGKSGKQMEIHDDPWRLLQELEAAARFRTSMMSTQFFVVQLSGLEQLLQQIQSRCREAFEHRKEPKTHRN